jgi:tetratricopeptide (TPR) repeat protein
MASSTPQFTQAVMLDRQGRLAEAAAAYRQVLLGEPRNGDALRLLGVALARMGQTQEAVVMLAGAAQIQPNNFALHSNLGNALSALGRYAEAIACYDRALALKPGVASSYRGRGLAQMRLNQLDAALSSLEEAVRLAPQDADAHSDVGVVLERLNRKLDAVRSLQRATELSTEHAEAHHNLGLIQATLGHYEAALASLDRALALKPNRPAIHGDRGDVLLSLGRPIDALVSYDRAIANQPADAATWHNRGVALVRLERCGEAVASFDQALVLAPELFNAHFHRGVALLQLDRHAEALAGFDRALALNPTSAEALNNRGVALMRLMRPDEALQSFAHALACKPDHAEACPTAGNTLKGLQRYGEALDYFDRAHSIQPDEAMTIWSKALIKLTLGEFRDGWPLYESRFRIANFIPLQRRFEVPRWSGTESLEGKTLLVHTEQGLGDTLQFCRYILLLEARGARVVFEVQPVLRRFLSSLNMRGALLAHGDSLPRVDFVCPLLSLPLAFRTQLDDIPGGVPYVSADGAAAEACRQRLGALPGLKVGLNWQGNSATEQQPWLRGRSFALREAAALARLPGVNLVSLQRGEGIDQLARVEFNAQIAQFFNPHDLGPDAVDETAALITALDLVITSDTFVAHLAGALGAPVWLVLPFEADWRWLSAREDSPWYPTMRLFRQRRPGDWPELFDRVAHELRALQYARSHAQDRPALPTDAIVGEPDAHGGAPLTG